MFMGIRGVETGKVEERIEGEVILGLKSDRLCILC